MLSPNQIRANARKFSLEWKDETRERAESQTFWNEFFAVFGVNRRKVGIFEATFKKLKGTQGFIDVYWPKKLVCEQKSRGADLAKATTQALDYLQSIAKVAEEDLPRYVIVCDFEHLHLLDIETQQQQKILVANLADNIELFGFISGYETEFRQQQEAVNIAAAERMGRLHDQLKENGYDGHELRVMLIRLLFCLFAEDTQIFNKNQFYNFLVQRTQQDGSDLAAWISQLFDTLNREKRLKNLDEQLNAFAYINGELFKEVIPPAAFDAKMRQELIDACETDWQAISPEIFGALFQSVMNKEERRNLGAHYTSEQNILKVINSLFLQELRDELATIKTHKQVNMRAAKLDVFHDKIARLTFLDPACGCGNFLVVAYRELRLLELEVIEQIQKDSTQLIMDVSALIRCNVNQFYGIEIEEFPSQIARVAMWLVDHQMNLLVSDRFGMHYARIPLKRSAAILNANALQTDWPVTDYILGNPPFIGSKLIDKNQRIAFDSVMSVVPKSGVLDFVSAWYVKAAQLIKANAHIRCALVSTNSITQGEQVGILWGWMLAQGMVIQFAHRTFVWQSAAKGKAAVHCVIIGFGTDNTLKKTIFDYEDGKGLPMPISANNINAYLVDAKNIFIENKRESLIDMSPMNYGSFALDDGYYTLDVEEVEALIKTNSAIQPFIKPFIGGRELLSGKKRYCLWFFDANIKTLRSIPELMARIDAVQKWRSESDRENTKKLAQTPMRFAEIRQPKSQYIAIPTVSSERRNYLPIAFLSPDVIASNQLYLIDNANLYIFGIMTSIMHNAWMRTTCGRLKSDYRYSASIVYNNFPWPLNPTDKQKQTIEAAAQAVLDARAAHPTCSLADLYDPLTMPANLLKAHQQLDKAVDAAYGKTKFANEAERVAFLFELYQQYTASIEQVKPKKTRK
ncbi:MAG TPA: class I SAM-dependent DNA methyltransferase [Agitococcus sp.]|nr:class I SAM-dependent DNA methyltransferase [Agitococcus sp.]HMX99974.1 class I SAM-dependent DNA methyltransferase [Agitococcus sp.]HMY82494.1 class I SAM-dependent DNA methyltransferase [Agitococcus sp.]HNC02962.1 class I SAM-dependent DNA methyltransferase [Agitococcus sp.]HNI63411.1 class I SAM-dependent DNA methyltransferase [Agitococcus sp.]